MKVRFTEETVKRLEAPEKGFRRYTDATEPFFGVRVTKAGAITFVLRYRNRIGDQRDYPIGMHPAWRCQRRSKNRPCGGANVGHLRVPESGTRNAEGAQVPALSI